MMESQVNKMKIALVAHNSRKATLLELVRQYKNTLCHAELVATRNTGLEVRHIGLDNIQVFDSGPEGGDVEIANMIIMRDLDILIFLIDPLSTHAHESDIQTLVRESNIHNVVFATNLATARVILDSLKKHKSY